MGPAVHISIHTPIHASRLFQRRNINTATAAEKRRLPHLMTHNSKDEAAAATENDVKRRRGQNKARRGGKTPSSGPIVAGVSAQGFPEEVSRREDWWRRF